MRILLVTRGSQGDVYPYLRLAAALKNRGHSVSWCTHGCWIMSSMNFNPGKMISMLIKANKETKRLSQGKSVAPDEATLRGLEEKYGLDREKLGKIGLVKAAGAA